MFLKPFFLIVVIAVSNRDRLGASAAAFAAGGGAAVMAQNKSWKKCPTDEREKFLRNVMDFMTNAFSSSNRTQMLTFLFNGENAGLTNEQRVAKWQFILMDISRDKVLTRHKIAVGARNHGYILINFQQPDCAQFRT